MNTIVKPFVFSDSAAIFDRHAFRRTSGIPTVSLLVGPLGAAGRSWRRWTEAAGQNVVVAKENRFPNTEWIESVAAQVD